MLFSIGLTTAASSPRVNPMLKSIVRSEEHTSELQSQSNLVCRLLLEKKNIHQDREKVRPRADGRGQAHYGYTASRRRTAPAEHARRHGADGGRLEERRCSRLSATSRA